MKLVFADTNYWVAVLNPNDELHEKAISVSKSLGGVIIITSEMVLTELLNCFAEKGQKLRMVTIELAKQSKSDPNVKVIPQTSLIFSQAMKLYEERLDKEWSLTDCASFLLMQNEKITEALTHDKHFEQAGYKALLIDQE
jgi:predicted nucleic acid-binding protein